MENQIPLWVKIITSICCVFAIFLLAAWSVFWDRIKERSKVLLQEMLPAATKYCTRLVFVAERNVAKLAYYMNRHLAHRPRSL
jgi:hypothetical protein